MTCLRGDLTRTCKIVLSQWDRENKLDVFKKEDFDWQDSPQFPELVTRVLHVKDLLYPWKIWPQTFSMFAWISGILTWTLYQSESISMPDIVYSRYAQTLDVLEDGSAKATLCRARGLRLQERAKEVGTSEWDASDMERYGKNFVLKHQCKPNN
jgi:hypothetical protein